MGDYRTPEERRADAEQEERSNQTSELWRCAGALEEIARELQISNRRAELAEAIKTRLVLNATGRALQLLPPVSDFGRATLQRSEDNQAYLDGLRLKLHELIRSRDE